MNVTLVDHIVINGNGFIKFITNPWVFGSILIVVLVCVYMFTHRHDKKTFIFRLDYEKPSMKTITQKTKKTSMKHRSAAGNRKKI